MRGAAAVLLPGLLGTVLASNSIFRIVEVVVDPQPVVIDLYYESLCPGCKYFVETQLFPTMYKLEQTGILKINMYPYGNAKEIQNTDGSWRFECQHGAKECTGNIIEACIISYLREDKAYVPVLACMESSNDPISAARGCVSALSDVDYKLIKQCAKGAEGNALMHQMGLATEKLNPPHNYVPWVVVNGNHNETIENQALTDLTGLVCLNFQGEKPRQCLQDRTAEHTKHTRKIY